jgi:hypothetical protein
MTQWTDQDDDDGGDWDADDSDAVNDHEGPDPADTNPGDTGAIVPCPFCRRAVHEDADLCPGCGNFIGGSDDPSPRWPWWITIGTILLLVAFVLGYLKKPWW